MTIYPQCQLPDTSSNLPAVIRPETKLLYDFAPDEVCLCRFCYQTRGRLLPCLFTLTCFQAVIFCSTFCQFRGYAIKDDNCPVLPGYYPASFPVEPGLYLPRHVNHLTYPKRSQYPEYTSFQNPLTLNLLRQLSHLTCQ